MWKPICVLCDAEMVFETKEAEDLYFDSEMMCPACWEFWTGTSVSFPDEPEEQSQDATH